MMENAIKSLSNDYTFEEIKTSLEQAKKYARELKEDEEFYKECSETSREYYNNSLYNEKNFVPYITRIFEELHENN